MRHLPTGYGVVHRTAQLHRDVHPPGGLTAVEPRTGQCGTGRSVSVLHYIRAGCSRPVSQAHFSRIEHSGD